MSYKILVIKSFFNAQIKGLRGKNILEKYVRNLREANQELQQENELLKSKISAIRKFKKNSEAKHN